MRMRRLAPLAAVVALPAAALVPLALSDGSAQARTSPGVLTGADLARLGAPASGTPGPDAPGSFNATLPNGRRVTPAGVSVQVGQNPLNSVLTPDGKFLITSNDDERNAPPRTGTTVDPKDTKNGADKALSQYAVTITDTATMKVVASVPVPARLAPPNPGSTSNGRTNTDKTSGLFLGVAVLPAASGYTVYAAGGVADVLYKYAVGADGAVAGTPTQIPMPVSQDKTQAMYGMAVPGWITLSDDRRTLYVVNNDAGSVTPVDVATDTPGTPVPVGYFPYAAQQVGNKLFVSNWGVTTRTFADGAGTTDPTTGVVTHSFTTKIGGGTTNKFANPETSPTKSSSLSVLDLRGGLSGGSGAISLARPIDGLYVVGGTHPSALAYAKKKNHAALFVADANEDTVAVVDPRTERVLRRVLMRAPVHLDNAGTAEGESPGTFGLTPNALAVSPDQRWLYVAEAGLNSVAVYSLGNNPQHPHFRGRIPAGWYPTGVTVSPDGQSLFITNAKGAGSPYGYQGTFVAPGVYTNPDVNWTWGSVQKVSLAGLDLKASTRTVLANTVARKTYDKKKLATLQRNVKHVIFILRENKTYDTYFGDDAVLNARGANGDPAYAQYGPYVPNTKALAEQFNVGDNNHADSEESNAGHQFALAGTTTDRMQKTLLERGTRPLTNIKNQDPDDYPLQGYIYNAMARNGRSFRDYGDNIRISGYDDGSSPDFCSDDPKPGCDNTTYSSIADTTSPTVGLGGTYSETLPALKVLGGHLDETYPGWNLRISDQRRAAEFIKDYGSLIDKGAAPEFTSLWLPGDHTGGCAAPGLKVCAPTAEVADNDKALGQVLEFLTHSSIWKDTAIFISQDDAQGSPDHVYAHRTYTMVVSPWAKRGAVVHTLGSTVSIPKTIEEILDLPAMSYYDLVANDLLDYFTTTPDYTPYTAVTSPAAETALQEPVAKEAARVWALAGKLDTATYDVGTARIGQLTKLYFAAADLAKAKGTMSAKAYAAKQAGIFAAAKRVVQ